jgi:hypothetical protein
MITDFILNRFMNLLDFVLTLLPTTWLSPLLTDVLAIDLSFLKYVYVFISPWVLSLIINVFVTVYMITLTWAIVEWLYKKIPGVD